MSELEEQLIETTNEWHEAFRERGRHSFYHGQFYVREASCSEYTSVELLHSRQKFTSEQPPGAKIHDVITAPLRFFKDVYCGSVTGELKVHLRDGELHTYFDINRNRMNFQGTLQDLTALQLPRDIEDERDFLLEQYSELLQTYSDTT